MLILVKLILLIAFLCLAKSQPYKIEGWGNDDEKALKTILRTSSRLMRPSVFPMKRTTKRGRRTKIMFTRTKLQTPKTIET